MESEVLAKTLEVLKGLSELESAAGEFYLFCSGVRESEKEFWLELEQEEKDHAGKFQEIARMLEEKGSLVVPNSSFNPAPIQQTRNFIHRSLKRLQALQIPTDYKTLLSIAWNIEYSILEIKYNELFSIAEQGYETVMRSIIAETTAHRGKLGAQITSLRNQAARGHSRTAAKGAQNPAQKRASSRQS